MNARSSNAYACPHRVARRRRSFVLADAPAAAAVAAAILI